MKIVRSLAAIAGLFAYAAAAQAAPRNDAAMVYSVSESDLVELVQAVGDTVDAVHPFENDPSVRGKTKDGLKYLFIATDCPEEQQTGCKSIMMQVRYTADDEVTLKGINDANYNEAAVGSWWNQDSGTVGFTRFVYMQGGVTWANLKANYRMLIDAHWNAQDAVWPPKK